MWCLVNHTKKHIVATDMFDVGRQFQSMITYASWKLTDHIDIEDVDPKIKNYPGYTFDL